MPGQCTAASALSALQFMTATKVAHPLTAACKCESVQSESINALLLTLGACMFKLNEPRIPNAQQLAKVSCAG